MIAIPAAGISLFVTACISGTLHGEARTLCHEFQIRSITYFASTLATASVDGAPVLSLTTAQGAAATLDCYVFGMLGQ